MFYKVVLMASVDFKQASIVANWMALGSVIACCFLLLSFACLSVQKTSQHYLTIGIVAGTGLLTVRLNLFCFDYG